MEASQKKYSINYLSLSFKDKSIKDDFSYRFYKEDLYALRFVVGLGIALSMMFAYIDMNRYEDPWISIGFRIGMASLLALFGYLSVFITPKRYRLTQYYGISISIIVVVGFFVHYHFNTDPDFDIFLSNTLTITVYIIATIAGLRFRYAFIIITLAVFSYFIYIPFFNYSAIAMRQITQMIVVYLFTILSSYVLERQKINLFISRAILDEEKSKVESLGAVRNKLFSIISHDLRSPIQSLKGVVSLLNKEAITKEEFKVLSKNLEEKLIHTSYLMDNLLAWSKSQMDGIVINRSSFSMKNEVMSVVDSFKLDLEKKAIALKYAINNELIINADKEMMHIVIRNLISNAIKFTPTGGTIKIEGYTDKKFVNIFISDNGSGISKEKMTNLFKLNKSNLIGSVQLEGAGLGLLLVKEFTELNQGIINCNSSLGNGTQFILKFPLP